jgi:hypothetical protein
VNFWLAVLLSKSYCWIKWKKYNCIWFDLFVFILFISYLILVLTYIFCALILSRMREIWSGAQDSRKNICGWAELQKLFKDKEMYVTTSIIGLLFDSLSMWKWRLYWKRNEKSKKFKSCFGLIIIMAHHFSDKVSETKRNRKGMPFIFTDLCEWWTHSWSGNIFYIYIWFIIVFVFPI